MTRPDRQAHHRPDLEVHCTAGAPVAISPLNLTTHSRSHIVDNTPELGSRALFPSLAPRIYANHASVGPLPTPAVAAMTDVMTRQATHGVAAMAGFHEDLEHTRALAGELMGVDSSHVALMPSTSMAISSVAASIPWQPGDRVVLFSGEFPANTTPWQRAADQYGLDLIWLSADAFRTEEGLAQLSQVLSAGRVRMVAVSAVQFSTGLRMPVEAMGALAHQHGAEIFVDAIQALGSTPFDATDLDYIASGGQKWLMGPPGTAMLYVRDWDRLRPTLAGWLSHVDALSFLWGDPDQLDYDRAIQSGPALFEGGTLNFAGLAGLTAALEINRTIGVPSIFAHANAWIDQLEQSLVPLGFESLRATDPSLRSCILAAKPPEGIHAGELAGALAEHGISVSTPDAVVRFSPSWPNSAEEPSAIVETLTPIVGRML